MVLAPIDEAQAPEEAQYLLTRTRQEARFYQFDRFASLARGAIEHLAF